MTGGGLDEKASAKEGWVKVVKGSKITKNAVPCYLELSNSYANLGKLLTTQGPPHMIDKHANNGVVTEAEGSTFNVKAAKRRRRRVAVYAQ